MAKAKTKLKTPRTKRVRTDDQLADVEFKATKLDLDRLPTNEEFGKVMSRVRAAAVMITKSKAQTVDIVNKLSDEATLELIDGLSAADKELRGFADICRTGFARLCSGAMAVEKSRRKPSRAQGTRIAA